MMRLNSPKAITNPASKSIPKVAKVAPSNAPIAAPTSAPISAPSDYTPFPSLSPVSPAHKGGSTTDEGGKGKGTQKEKKLTFNELMQEDKEAHAAYMADLEKKFAKADPDELAYQQKKADAQADRLAKVKAITKDKKLLKDQKRAKLLTLLPRDPTAPANIWHPSDKYQSGKGVVPWHTWSAEMLIEKQDQYDEIVANTKSKAGKTAKSFY